LTSVSVVHGGRNSLLLAHEVLATQTSLNSDMIDDTDSLLAEQRAALRFPDVTINDSPDGTHLNGHNSFTAPRPTVEQLERVAASSHRLNRGMGALAGLAVADSIGHPLEFVDVAPESGKGLSSWSLREFIADGSTNPFLDSTNQSTAASLTSLLPLPRAMGGRRAAAAYSPGYTNPFNKFGLDAGQWTDDTSMALCLADSLLRRRRFDGSDCRVLFWAWWFGGYNNAFRKDSRRSGSCGLGGNISRSLYSMEAHETPAPAFDAAGEDAGNGSLMRLAPVALFHCGDTQRAAEDARASSYTTHPGPIAAEACAFLASLLVLCIDEFDASATSARAFVCAVADEYAQALEERAGERGVAEVCRLLRSNEPDGGTERNWNWRADSLALGDVMRARGDTYNGYPNSAGYFGSYCLDGLAIALHSVCQTASFDGAIEHCVNFLGDADSHGAICGQIAGALYGYRAIHPKLRANLHAWDDGQVALRAALLMTSDDGCDEAGHAGAPA